MRDPAKVLGNADVRRVLELVRRGTYPRRDETMVLLSLKAGLRAKEMAGLTWAHVLSAGGKLSPHISLPGSITKRGRPRRVPINPALAVALKRLHGANGKPRSGPVLRSRRGTHLTAKGVVNRFLKLYASAGLHGCSSHSGRRTFITRTARLLPKVGASLRDVQILVGHSALSVTQRYIDGSEAHQVRLVRLL